MSSQITRIANIIIPVADQENALKFYTGILGFETRADMPFGPGQRWIEVAPAGVETTIAICPPGPGVTAGGKDTGITLNADDIDALHTQLKEQGVDVDAEVARYGDDVPPMFWFRDTEKNTLSVVEAK
jgi:predicted enzyme related to lactoylglutathione lyase